MNVVALRFKMFAGCWLLVAVVVSGHGPGGHGSPKNLLDTLKLPSRHEYFSCICTFLTL